MGEAETTRERIDRLLPELSAAQRRVAVYVSERHTRVGYLSATEIGRAVGVSDATVVRTAQRLGYDGLIELKGAMARELAEPSLSERLRNSLEADSGPVQEVVSGHIDGLQRLLTAEMVAAANDTVRALLDGERVLLVGSGPSAPIAAYGAELLGRIGLDARAVVRSGLAAADDIASLRPGDVVVLLAYSQVAPHVDALLHRAEHLDVLVVLLTDHLPAPPGRSIVLRAGRGSPTGAASHVTTVAMLEVLALLTADAGPERATATLDEVNRLRDRIARHTAGSRNGHDL